jgi:hypothetical protein
MASLGQFAHEAAHGPAGDGLQAAGHGSWRPKAERLGGEQLRQLRESGKGCCAFDMAGRRL